MGDYVRNNLDLLRERQDDLRSSVKDLNTFKAQTLSVNQTGSLFYAVIGIPSSHSDRVRITSRTLTPWHANIKLTFTPQSDEVLFAVQLSLEGYGARGGHEVRFGLRQGDTDLTLQDTARTIGDLGSSTTMAKVTRKHGGPSLARYEVPLSVTRNVEITISPTVSVSGGGVTFENPSQVLLTALDVGSYT